MNGVAMLGNADKVIRDALEEFDQLKFVQVTSRESLDEALSQAEIMVISNSQFDQKVAQALMRAPRLKWIQFSSTGYDGATRFGVPAQVIVTNARGVWAKTVAEHGVALLLALIRDVPALARLMKAKKWDRTQVAQDVRTLEGMRAAVVGYGAIGQELARKLKAFDVHVLAFNRSGVVDNDQWHDECYPISRLKETLPTADIIALCTPLTDATRHLLSRDEISAMKEGSYIINVARGPVIDEKALIEALRNKRLGGCGLDVAAEEPLSRTSPLWSFENVMISPHVGGFGGRAGEHFKTLLKENIQRFKAGKSLLNCVDAETGEYRAG